MPNRYPPSSGSARSGWRLIDWISAARRGAWGVAQALGPKLGVGPETFRKWV